MRFTGIIQRAAVGLVLAALGAGVASAVSLPEGYFRLLEAGAARVEARLNAEPGADLKTLGSKPGWRHFPYSILAPAVLYAKQHPKNDHYLDPAMLALAIRIGDLLAREDEQGTFAPLMDSDWDTYMWLESYRLLEDQLGAERKARWGKAIQRNVALVVAGATERLDFPWYNTPYIGTSPNHYAQWAGNLLVAGRVFGNKKWEDLGTAILHRYAAVEQTPDGYWGEHSRRGPTIGYNHLTLTAVGLYWEFTGDPAAMRAMRRATTLHKYFTYPDGTPADVLNDRNRRWEVSAWGQFAFSHFADGRGYAEFLAGFFHPDDLKMTDLGRLAQDALYYHEGPASTPPQEQERYSHRLKIPAGIRKTGPWVVCLSGIIDTPAPGNRYYLDRQGNMTIFHEKLGMIITGANSKRQPELATFSAKYLGRVMHLPLSSRLQMGETQDRLSLGFSTFWADLLVPEPAAGEMSFHFVINGRGKPPEEPELNLQLVLKAGATLVTGAGRRITLGPERIVLTPADLGGSISHRGWTMKVDPTARLTWPVYPQNPYADARETDIKYAVGRLTVPLRLKEQPGHFVRPNEQRIDFRITADER